MPKKRSKSPKRPKPKKKSSPTPPKTSGAGKRSKSKERKKSPSRAKESPLIQTKRISIKATQVSEGSLEDILQQLGADNSRASLTIQTRETRGRSLVRSDRTSKVEPTIQPHIHKPLQSNAASDLKQTTNTELLRAQTTRKNSYRIDADPRVDYRETQRTSERTIAPRELFIVRDSEEFEEQNIRTIQYEIVPPAKEFQQKTSSETPKDIRYVRDSQESNDFKQVNNNKEINKQIKQIDRNDTSDNVESSSVRPLDRSNYAEVKQTAYRETSTRRDYQTKQDNNDRLSHSPHEVHNILPAPKYPTVYTEQQQKSYLPVPSKKDDHVQQNNMPMKKDTTPRPDHTPKRQSDQAQQKTAPMPKATYSRSDQIPSRESEQTQPKALPTTKATAPRPDNTLRRQPDQTQPRTLSMTKDTTPRSDQAPRRQSDQSQQKNIPASQETMPRSDKKVRRQSDQPQWKDIPTSEETISNRNKLLRRQAEQEAAAKAMLKRPDVLPENTSKQSDETQGTLKPNVLYKGALPNLVLYYDIMSPQARSCLMLISLLKLDVELKYTDIFKGDQLTEEYLKLNPVHTVPTLVTDDMIFTDSHTILMYLCDNSSNPLAKQLYPQSYLIRLKIMNCLFFEAQVLYRRHSNFMTDIVRKEFANIDYAFHEKKILEAYETLNSFLKDSLYLVGDTMTIADISIVATISALDLMFPIDQYQNVWPELANWFRNMRSIPMYRLNFAGVMKQGDVVEKYGKFEFNNKNS